MSHKDVRSFSRVFGKGKKMKRQFFGVVWSLFIIFGPPTVLWGQVSVEPNAIVQKAEARMFEIVDEFRASDELELSEQQQNDIRTYSAIIRGVDRDRIEAKIAKRLIENGLMRAEDLLPMDSKQEPIVGWLQTDRQSARTKLSQVYNKEFAINHWEKISEIFRVDFQRFASKAEELMEERRMTREEDQPYVFVYFDLVPGEDDSEIQAILQKIAENEKKRAAWLSQEILNLCGEPEAERLSKSLVRRFSMQALEMPLVQNFFRMTADQVAKHEEITVAGLRDKQAFLKANPGATSFPLFATSYTNYFKQLTNLPPNQARKFLEMRGHLREGAPVDSLLEHVPKQVHGQAAEMLMYLSETDEQSACYRRWMLQVSPSQDLPASL